MRNSMLLFFLLVASVAVSAQKVEISWVKKIITNGPVGWVQVLPIRFGTRKCRVAVPTKKSTVG